MTDSSSYSPFKLAEQALLTPWGLGVGDLERLIGGLMAPSIDFADIYFEYSRRESWYLEDGIVRDSQYSVEQGAGVRAISGEKTGFAYSDELRLPALEQASTAARAIAQQ